MNKTMCWVCRIETGVRGDKALELDFGTASLGELRERFGT